jgi:hypothetical protein
LGAVACQTVNFKTGKNAALLKCKDSAQLPSVPNANYEVARVCIPPEGAGKPLIERSILAQPQGQRNGVAGTFQSAAKTLPPLVSRDQASNE